MNATNPIPIGFIEAYQGLYGDGEGPNFDSLATKIQDKFMATQKNQDAPDRNRDLLSLRHVLQINIIAMEAYSKDSFYEKAVSFFRGVFGVASPIRKAQRILKKLDEAIVRDESLHAETITDPDLQKKAIIEAQRRLLGYYGSKKDRAGVFYNVENCVCESLFNPEKDGFKFRKEIDTSVLKSSNELKAYLASSQAIDRIIAKGNASCTIDEGSFITQNADNEPKIELLYSHDTITIPKEDISSELMVHDHCIHDEGIKFEQKNGDGKCAGISWWFLFLYEKTKHAFPNNPHAHLKAVAEEFDQGTGPEAIFLQIFEHESRKQLLNFETSPEIGMGRAIDWDLRREQFIKRFQNLPDGMYRIGIPNHSMVYIKEPGNLGFLFDPNFGIFPIVGCDQAEKLYERISFCWRPSEEDKKTYEETKAAFTAELSKQGGGDEKRIEQIVDSSPSFYMEAVKMKTPDSKVGPSFDELGYLSPYFCRPKTEISI